MKQIFLLWLLVNNCLTCITLSSQNWITPGQTWEYYFANGNAQTYLEKYFYDTDTLIQGRVCQKIVIGYRLVTPLPPPHTDSSRIHPENSVKRSIFTSNSGDTVYQWNQQDERFDMLYYFNAQPGERWKLPEFFISTGCDSSYVIVDSIGTLNFANQTLRWISIHPEGIGQTALDGKIIENFGAIGHFFLHSYYNCTGLFDYAFGHPLCYSHPIWGDLTFLENMSFPPGHGNISNCDFYEIASIRDQNSDLNYLRVSPLPGKDLVKVELQNYFSGNFRIIDLQGREQSSGLIKGTSHEIDISDWNSGVYFIHYFSNSSRFFAKLLRQ